MVCVCVQEFALQKDAVLGKNERAAQVRKLQKVVKNLDNNNRFMKETYIDYK